MTIVAVKIILVVSHSIAFIATALRLIHRKRRSRLWWDDLWAFVALLFDTLVWILFITIPRGRSYSQMSQFLRMFSNLGLLSAYTTALWASRISISVTIVRLLNPGKFRSIAKIVTIMFGLFWLVLIIHKMFRCGINTLVLTWCPIPRVTGYIELGADILGDSWLVLAPAYMLWIMKISRFHRWLVFGIFACSVLTIGASVAHNYFIFVQSTAWIGPTAHIQSTVSITVCNLLVLVTYVYRSLFNVQEHAAISTSYSTSEGRLDQPSAVEPELPPASERGATVINLTDLGSNFGNTLNSTLSTAPTFGDNPSRGEGSPTGDDLSFETSQPRMSAKTTYATV